MALQAKANCEHLIIGIANPDPDNTKPDESHSERAKAVTNPWTYYERLLMVKETLLDIGLLPTDFDIVPFPINYPERIKYYVPADATHFTRVYEPWNYRKLELLTGEGYEVEVLFEGTPEEKKHEFTLPIGGLGKAGTVKAAEGTIVRKLMGEGGDWQTYVPAGTASVVVELDLISRLQAESSGA